MKNSRKMKLLSKEILNENLYNDLKLFAEQDYRVNPDIFVTNYLYFASFFCSDRIKLALGNDRPTNSNLFMTVVGNSGLGKSYINQFFYKPIMDIQTELHIQDKVLNQFANACRNYNDSNDDLTPEQKEGFVIGYNKKHNTDFTQFITSYVIPHVFTVNDFSPEALSIKFKGTKNNTILLNADEFEELQNNVSRTKTVENTFSFLTTYFDGKTELIIRKTQDDLIINDAKLAVLANTVPSTFEKLKHSEFFNSGLGYRHLFYINNQTNIEDPTLAVKSSIGISIYDQYQAKIGNIFRTFFFNMVYMSEGEMVILKINEEANLKVYNECVLRLWNDHIKTNDNLRDSQKESFRSRLSTMFNKCILNTFIMNYSYGNRLRFPFDSSELTADDIMRGYYVYDFYLSHMVYIFDITPKSDLTQTEQRILELLEIGKPYDRNGVKAEVLKMGIGSESTFKRMMLKKSKQFTVAYNRNGHKSEIIRHF
jgi:ribosomal protein L30E